MHKTRQEFQYEQQSHELPDYCIIPTPDHYTYFAQFDWLKKKCTTSIKSMRRNLRTYTLGKSSNRSLRNFNILAKLCHIQKSLCFKKSYFMDVVIEQIIILIDLLTEFLSRDRDGYPLSVVTPKSTRHGT